MDLVSAPAEGAPLPVGEASPATLKLLAARRSPPAHTLGLPGPDAAQLDTLLTLAARVPDHGKLTPWRFVVLEGEGKQRFVAALEELAAAQENATKAAAGVAKLAAPPLVVAVISRATEGRIPLWEQQLSAGAACMNLLVAAHAMGFGGNWITGWYAYDATATRLLGLAEQERVAGFVLIGTPTEPPRERPRAALADLVSRWSEAPQ